MNVKYISFAFLFFALFSGLRAQQLPVFDHYSLNGLLYNPAYTGADSLGNISVNHRQQWSNMPFSPISSFVTADAPILHNRLGIGGSIYLDQTHIIQRVGVSLNYAYHISFAKFYPHKLSFGISAGFVNQRLSIDDNTVVKDPFDLSIAGAVRSANAFDLNFGVQYRYRGLKLGFSIPQLTQSELSYHDVASGPQSQGGVYTLVRHYYARAALEIPLGQRREFSVEPGVLARFANGFPFQADFNVWCRYKNRGHFGLGYRTGNDQYSTSGVHFSVGVEAFKVFTITATYENMLDPTLRASLGNTLEFMVSVKFGGMAKKIQELERRLIEQDEKLKIRNADDDGEVPVKPAPKVEAPVINRKAAARFKATQMAHSAKQLQQMEDKMVQMRLDSVATISGGKRFRNQDTIESVFFANASSELSLTYRNRLKKVAEIVSGRDSSKITLVLYGNAAELSTPEQNMSLALHRAKAVKVFLTSLKVKAPIMVTVNNGTGNPMENKTKDPNMQALYRKVDVVIGDQ